MSKLSLAIGFTLVWAAGVHAAEVLEEVTVLADRATAATKTDTKLVEIPQSISVVTEEQIAERGALNYQDVFRYSAGVDTERFGTDTRSDEFSARGFPVVQYLDGLNRSPHALYGSRTEVFTLERAEVLRGPSAVLYGAGSSGGLLNAVSKRPQFAFGGELGLEFGSFKRKQVQADITGPLDSAGTLAGRFVGVVRDGELQSPGQPNDKVVAMPALTWTPGENTDITFIGMYQREDLGTQTYLPRTRSLDAPAGQRLPIDFFVGEPDFNHMKAKLGSATLLVRHAVSDRISVSSQTRYLDQQVDYREVYASAYGGADAFLDPQRNVLAREFYVLDDDYQILTTDNSAQFDFQTGPLTHKVLVGLDYTRFDQDRQEGFSCRDWVEEPCFAGGSPPPLNIDQRNYGQPFAFGFTNVYTTRSTQLGFYLQDQIKYGDRVSFVVGGRRDRSVSQTAGAAEDVNKATTFRAGLIVEVIDGVSPYLSYSESFQPVFGADVHGVPYKPREGRQYEAGIKWQPSANSLVSVAYFDIEDSNFLTSDPDNLQNFIQAGQVGSKGYEFEAILNLEAGFSVTANYSHLKAEVLRGTLDHPAGDRVEDLPDDLASLWLAKSFDLNANVSARVSAGVRYVGDKIDYYQNQITPSVTLADLSAQFSYGNWLGGLNINNLFDKEFYASCAAPSPVSGACSPGMTRNIVVTLTRKF